MYRLDVKKRMHIARYTLAFVWMFTGLTSVFFAPDIGYNILSNANINGFLADTCVYGGGLLDILLGIWLIVAKGMKACCITQVFIILTYTLLLTMIDASYWLHPFGPIIKNFPIIVLIACIYAEIGQKE